MAYSKIVITQSGVSGQPGISRKNIALSTLVTLTNASDGNLGVAVWEWTLIEKPPGSAISLSGSTTSTTTFTPDVEGRYVISLRINGLGDHTEGYSEIVVGVCYADLGYTYDAISLGKYCPPAAFEKNLANWDSNDKGSQPEINRLVRDLRNLIIQPIFQDVNGVRIPLSLPSSLIQSTNSASSQIAGFFNPINMADFPWVKSAKFYITCGRNGSTGTAIFLLYDINHAIIVDFFSTTFSLVYGTKNLTIGSSPGNLRNDGDTQYLLYIYITPGGGTDYAEVYNFGLLFEVV